VDDFNDIDGGDHLPHAGDGSLLGDGLRFGRSWGSPWDEAGLATSRFVFDPSPSMEDARRFDHALVWSDCMGLTNTWKGDHRFGL
jgi:hypothetical protein